MKLEKWALVAEIVSAVAIVLSLIFVGLQVRQSSEETAANSRALEANVRESMLNADLSILQTMLPYTHILEGIDPENELEAREQTMYSYMLGRTRENFWKQRQNGMLDDETYLSYRETFIRYLIQSDFHLGIWNANKPYLVPGFVAEIDQELRTRDRLPAIGQ
jgi:hypothetical protein